MVARKVSVILDTAALEAAIQSQQDVTIPVNMPEPKYSDLPEGVNPEPLTIVSGGLVYTFTAQAVITKDQTALLSMTVRPAVDGDE